MIKRSHFRNIISPVLIGLIILMMAFVVYNKPEELQKGSDLSLVETTKDLEDTDPVLLWNEVSLHWESLLPEIKINDSIVEYGLGFLDTPYVWAGSSKDGFDCSGYVYY